MDSGSAITLILIIFLWLILYVIYKVIKVRSEGKILKKELEDDKERYEHLKSLKEKFGKLSIEEIVLNEDIEYRDKIDILENFYKYEWEEASELIKTAEKERSKARLLAIKKKISKKAFELYSDIPVDDKRAPLSDEVKLFVWNRDGGKCVKCGSSEKLEFDHVIPFSKGGSNTARNIQLLCEKCNRSKGGELT